MARKSKARPSARTTSSRSESTPRDKIVGAFMELLAEKSFESIGLVEIGERAGVSLADLRGEFGSTLSILAGHIKDIDRQVLAGVDTDMAEESPRERLFDVMMRRLELLAPYREAARSLMRTAKRNPALALAFNGMTVRSQQWMLAAAGITAAGPKGMLRAQGLAVLFASVLRTWVDDEDEGLAKTLAALDRELARGQRFSGLLDELCKLPERACQFTRRARGSRRGRDRDEAVAT